MGKGDGWMVWFFRIKHGKRDDLMCLIIWLMIGLLIEIGVMAVVGLVVAGCFNPQRVYIHEICAMVIECGW